MLKERIEQGDYEVDPVAVADAILRRIELTRPARGRRLRTSARIPTARAPASTNATPGVSLDDEADPRQSPSRLRGRAFSSRRARAGTQTHSS